MRGKFRGVAARLAGPTRLPLLILLLVLAVAAPTAAKEADPATPAATATPAFNPATATAAEALAYFQQVGPGPGRHLEVTRQREPDGTVSIQAVSNCWGPYIVDYSNDNHHNTRAKICVEWATSPRSVRTRQRMSCYHDNTQVSHCRWAFQSELYTYLGGYSLRKVTDHTLPGGAGGPYYSSWLTQGDIFYPSARMDMCAYAWETWIRNTNGSPDWLVRYSNQPNILAFIPQQSSYRAQIC